MPYLTAKPGAIQSEHLSCHKTPCVECRARKHLNGEDWKIMTFYQRVADQIENVTPMGTEKGPPMLVLRLADLHAATMIYGVPPEDRAIYIDGARVINDCINGRPPEKGIHRRDPSEFEEPELILDGD